MRFNAEGRVLCERCKQANGRLHVVSQNEGADWDDDIPYILVCHKCVSDIASWAPANWERATDNHQRLLWTRASGQIFTSDGSHENRAA